MSNEKDDFYSETVCKYKGMIDTGLMTGICYALNLTTDDFVFGAYKHCLHDLDIHSGPAHGGIPRVVQVYTDAPREVYYRHANGLNNYTPMTVMDVVLNYVTSDFGDRQVIVKIPTSSTLDPGECERVFTRLGLYLYVCYSSHKRYRNQTPKEVITIPNAIEELYQDLHDDGSEFIKKVRGHILKNYIIESIGRDNSIVCDTSGIDAMINYCSEKGYSELTMEILRITEEAGLHSREETGKLRL